MVNTIAPIAGPSLDGNPSFTSGIRRSRTYYIARSATSTITSARCEVPSHVIWFPTFIYYPAVAIDP